MALLDHNGVAVNVGDVVYLRGTVTAVNPGSTHFKDTTIQLSYPVAGVNSPELSGFPPLIEGGSAHGPGVAAVIMCPSTTLTH